MDVIPQITVIHPSLLNQVSKGLTGLRCSESWVEQMLGDQLESTELLANSFNTFLAGLTADFVPLPQIIPGSFFPVPEHLLVDTRMVYKALRGIKSNKSGGPDPIPGKVWKEFAFELSPVITNIYNASMVQGYVPVFLKQSEVVSVPKCSPPKVVETRSSAYFSHAPYCKDHGRAYAGFPLQASL